MFRRLLQFLRCRFRDLHTYAENPPRVAKCRCPDCGRKAILAKSLCCDRVMWLHLQNMTEKH